MPRATRRETIAEPHPRALVAPTTTKIAPRKTPRLMRQLQWRRAWQPVALVFVAATTTEEDGEVGGGGLRHFCGRRHRHHHHHHPRRRCKRWKESIASPRAAVDAAAAAATASAERRSFGLIDTRQFGQCRWSMPRTAAEWRMKMMTLRWLEGGRVTADRAISATMLLLLQRDATDP